MSSSRQKTGRGPSRRELLRTLGLSAVALPLGLLAACTRSSGSKSAVSGPARGAAPRRAGWATGGTAAMKGDYTDPFKAGLGSACTLTCAATLGPCYAETLTRKDISEGQLGLPLRMAFLIVDEKCRPIRGATLDIWHTAPSGLYSGAETSQMCTLGDPKARASRWFRGMQTSDENGRVDFDSCFPGWYSSRTIHVHFSVRIGQTEYVTSQLFFDDALSDQIVAGEPLYRERGARDTTNQNDGVVSANEVGAYSFQTERMADGVMLAWKTLVIRGSADSALCSLAGGARGMGGGMPPHRPPPF
ncbi:MAG: hypothetical protein QM756_46420 [Polyangiaceae bacterium]